RGGCGGGWPWVAVGCLEFNGSGHLRPNLGGCGWPWVVVVMKSGKTIEEGPMVMKRARW
ncbi:hypothetical protein FCV25MIE_16515, partial [Fagus crenata]